MFVRSRATREVIRFLGALLLVWPQTARCSSDTAAGVLCKALAAENVLHYSGQQTVLTFETGDGSATVTRESHLGPGRLRVDYLAPVSARGRILSVNGAIQRLYLPSSHTEIVSMHNTTAHASETPLQHVRRILNHYRLRLSSQIDLSTGRPARILDILPRDSVRSRQRAWIDNATSLVLRREIYRPDGVPISISSWQGLQFSLSPAQSKAQLVWNPGRGTRIIHVAAPITTGRYAKALRLGVPGVRMPRRLPFGFQFESAGNVNARGKEGRYTQYSDGLDSVSLIDVPQRITARPDDRSHRVDVSGISGTAALRGQYTVISWSCDRPRVTRSLVGAIPEKYLLQEARAIQSDCGYAITAKAN